jgi:hypothetical protein
MKLLKILKEFKSYLKLTKNWEYPRFVLGTYLSNSVTLSLRNFLWLKMEDYLSWKGNLLFHLMEKVLKRICIYFPIA